jgi:hypothetical protein
MSRPTRHRLPTKAFSGEELAIIRVPKSHQWMRVHLCDYAPMYFGGSLQNRFDSKEQSFGVLYLARQLNGSFVEVFCRDKQRLVSSVRLEQYCVAEFRASRNLKLIDLAGRGLVKMGLDARLATGSYATSQSWSQAFYEHPGGADGILYPSRHDPKQQLAALFDRSQSLLTVKQHCTLRNHLGNELFNLLDHYEIALV